MAVAFSDRARDVLLAVIKDYIHTTEPVGSRTVVERYAFDLSPATIRKIMAELEEEGYLRQPYPSAGRIPTDKGFRFYVDSLLKVRELSKGERERIKGRYKDIDRVEDIMKETTKVLSTHSRCMGLVLAPRFDNVIIRYIEFIRLGYKQILILLVSTTGMVHTRVIHIDEDIGQPDLEGMSVYLRGMAIGLTLRGLRAKVVEEMRREKTLYDRLMAKALQMSEEALRGEGNGDVYVEGRVNILNQPEFHNDVEKMKALFKALEEKGTLVRFLDKGLSAEGVQIYIGEDIEFNEIKDCSLVIAPYGGKGYTLGTIGVIGPVRMDYSKVIPLVDWTARWLGDVLATRGLEAGIGGEIHGR